MDVLIVGITGKRGSGKDTAAEYLKKKHGFRMLVFSEDILKPMLESQNRPPTRGNMINLAMELREEFGRDALAKMIDERINFDGRWVISGLRLPEEVEYFRLSYQKSFFLLSVESADRERYERIRKRGDKGEGLQDFKTFMEVEKRPTERQIGQVMKKADCRVKNSSTIKGLEREVDKAVKDILNKSGKNTGKTTRKS